jgi:arylsulfatase A-like enzyme
MTAHEDQLARSSLPIPDVPRPALTTYDATDPDTKYPPITPLRPPAWAPNVLVALIDDVGFGASSVFGGPCQTPNCERLAAAGLRYTRFHTTALCSPTRAALLSGRNHHSVGMGGITEIATSAPGYNSLRPNTKAAIAEVLRLNGYATAQFGKCHEVPVWETSPAGPFDHWPSPGGGFEYFYGFIGGETNQYYPAIYEGMTPLEPPKSPEEGYHFTEDMTDKAITWVRQAKALQPDRPFFMYWAPGATHAPHHVPKEWADKYKGAFDDGWDALRERTLARQKELGVIPADAELTKRHAEVPAWDEMDESLKPVLRREMEIYAGFLEHTDHHLGRLIDAINGLEVLGDTLVYVIIGDNGASAEGTLQGTFNEAINFNGFGEFETPEFLQSKIDDFGGPEAYNHYRRLRAVLRRWRDPDHARNHDDARGVRAWWQSCRHRDVPGVRDCLRDPCARVRSNDGVLSATRNLTAALDGSGVNPGEVRLRGGVRGACPRMTLLLTATELMR